MERNVKKKKNQLKNKYSGNLALVQGQVSIGQNHRFNIRNIKRKNRKRRKEQK